MKKYKIVIANWKMNMTVPESGVLLEKYKKEIKPHKTEVVVCPSFLDIYSANEAFSGTDFAVGAQNIFYEDAGAYTGEVSAHQLKGFAKYCLVGHSERRHFFGEGDKIVAKKAAACVNHGITPIVCVGENLHERMDGLTKLVVAGQTEASLSELTAKEVAESVIAYEPVWAIGTGHVCEPEKAAEAIKNIRNLIKVLHGEKTAEQVRIVYGGSLDAKNVKGFLKHSEIDGFLVGGASLDYAVFADIVLEVDGGRVQISHSKKIKKSNRKRIIRK